MRKSGSSARVRVALTGIGVVTPCGIGVQPFWESVRDGRGTCSALEGFSVPGCQAVSASAVKDFVAEDHLSKKEIKRLDRYCQFAVAAGRLALADAGMAKVHDRERTGVSMGSALGGISQAETQHARFIKEGPDSVARLLALQIFGGTAHAAMAIAFGIEGPTTTNSNSCAAGATAVLDAVWAIREGRADCMLAGGSEAPLSPLSYAAFDFISTMSRIQPSEQAFRPFDQRRDGFVMGEGSAVLLLERLDHAVARGARIYAEVAGGAITNDAHHMSTPREDGVPLRRMIQLALQDSLTEASDIGYVNAHASATIVNDITETRAIRQYFGENAPAVSGTKPVTGHSLGAVGAMEVCITALALHHGILPATINLDHPDPACPVDLIAGTSRIASVAAAMSHSFGFGGINSGVVLRKLA